VRDLDGFSEGMARAQRLRICLGDVGAFLELVVDPSQRRVEGTPVDPVHQPERPKVLAPPRFLGGQPGAFDRSQRVFRHVDRHHAVRRERRVFERVRNVASLLQVLSIEGAAVHYEEPAPPKIREVRFQGGRIHRHEHVRRIARREHIVRREIDLKAGDSVQRPRGRADFRWKIRKRREVVADDGRGRRELGSGYLHSVAGVAREANNGAVNLFGPACRFTRMRRSGRLLCRHECDETFPLPMGTPST
jgi:hypothetical protein